MNTPIPSKRYNSTRLVIVAVAAAVSLAVVFALVGGKSSSKPKVPGETQPVTIVGSALKKFADGTDPMVGTKAPTLEGKAFDGSARSITPGDGKATLVLFVAHWCPHCQREVPRIVAWEQAGQVPAGLQIRVVSTSVDPASGNYPASAWLAKVGVTDPVMADDDKSSAAAAYGLPGFPYFVLLRADGSVAKRFSGEIEAADLTKLINEALAS